MNIVSTDRDAWDEFWRFATKEHLRLGLRLRVVEVLALREARKLQAAGYLDWKGAECEFVGEAIVFAIVLDAAGLIRLHSNA